MKKLLLQLDSSPHASVFDQVVAYDAGADEIMSAHAVTPPDVRDLVHGCIFTRGPKHLMNTAVFIGGSDMSAGEAILTAAQKAFFGPFRVSLMLDSNGSNTTAVAAVVKIVRAMGGSVAGQLVVVTAGTGPVGLRAAGLLAQAGARVRITSRRTADGERAKAAIIKRFGGTVDAVCLTDAGQAAQCLEGAHVLLNCGPAGVQLVPRAAWANRAGLKVAADLNAVPPQGVEGIEPPDDGVTRGGVLCFGALGVGNFKMAIHKASIARLFESSDAVLDAESIHELAKSIAG
ncbi:MAG: NAD(P)-dependent methylenetetrahydromethanopterin dehydrogenase [Gemmatimonadales bacterium]